MGRSFNSEHIYNREGLTKSGFKKAFSDILKSKGYATSDEENATLTYTLIFSPDRKWVTVLCEDEDDTRNNSAEIAKALQTSVVNVELVDSDFAELSLFDSTGTHIDTLTLGESYLGDDAPTGSPECWQPLFTDDSTWEQVKAIQNGSYMFAEDALAEFAPLMGMDSDNILLCNDSTDDNNVLVLQFKKAVAREKKLTLNSAFVKYFGDLLLPYGFVKKTINKLPMFIRLINNEILQIVTYRKISSRKVGYSTFEIYSNIMTLYRELPDLSIRPESYLQKMRFKDHGLIMLEEDLVKRVIEYNIAFWQNKEKIAWNDIPEDRYTWYLANELSRVGFHFSPDFLTGMDIATDVAEKILLPAFECTKTLEQCIDYFYLHDVEMRFYGSAEYERVFHDLESFNILPFDKTSEALTLIVSNYRKDTTQYTEKQLELILKEISNIESDIKRGLEGVKDIDDYRMRYQKRSQMEINIRNLILDTSELREKALSIAKEVRERNIAMLQSYEII